VLGSLRRTLAALELNVETLLAARQAGRDETWRRVAEKFYAAGLRAAEAAGDTAPVVPLRAMASA